MTCAGGSTNIVVTEGSQAVTQYVKVVFVEQSRGREKRYLGRYRAFRMTQKGCAGICVYRRSGVVGFYLDIFERGLRVSPTAAAIIVEKWRATIDEARKLNLRFPKGGCCGMGKSTNPHSTLWVELWPQHVEEWKTFLTGLLSQPSSWVKLDASGRPL